MTPTEGGAERQARYLTAPVAPREGRDRVHGSQPRALPYSGETGPRFGSLPPPDPGSLTSRV